jgi:hypothetical protein
MNIPDGVTPMREPRLDVICAVSVLTSRINPKKTGWKDQIKAAAKTEGAEYLQSDYALGHLVAGKDKGEPSMVELRKLVDAGRITLEELLGCCSASKDALKKILSENEVDALCSTSEGSKSLVVEFKPGVNVAPRDLAGFISEGLWLNWPGIPAVR